MTSVLIIGVLPFLFNAHAYAGEKRDSVGLTYGLKATAQTTYIWRSMYSGGPNIELDANVGYGGAYIDMWWHLGATDYTFSKFLPEVDLTIGFARWGFDVNLLYIHNFNCPFFDFRNYVDKGNRLEINASYTISKLIPLGFHWATRIAAADGYIDEQGKLVQAYSSFAEVYYTQKLPFGLTLYGAFGITPWRSCYTAYKRNFAVQNSDLDWALGAYVGGLGVVLGHCWPVLYRFKGGKGVACFFAFMFFTFPLGGAITFAFALGVYFLCHKISLVSMTSSVLFTILCAVNHAQQPWLWLFALACTAIIVVRHRDNIKRLIAGTESTINY